jgi:hypothetical protein
MKSREAALGGDLEVVVHRLQRVVVAVQADVAHAHAGHQPHHALHHPQPRAQDGDHGQLLPRQHMGRGLLQRRLDLHLLQRQVLGDLVRHEHGDLVHQLLELLLARLLVAQHASLCWISGCEMTVRFGKSGTVSSGGEGGRWRA